MKYLVNALEASGHVASPPLPQDAGVAAAALERDTKYTHTLTVVRASI